MALSCFLVVLLCLSHDFSSFAAPEVITVSIPVYDSGSISSYQTDDFLTFPLYYHVVSSTSYRIPDNVVSCRFLISFDLLFGKPEEGGNPFIVDGPAYLCINGVYYPVSVNLNSRNSTSARYNFYCSAYLNLSSFEYISFQNTIFYTSIFKSASTLKHATVSLVPDSASCSLSFFDNTDVLSSAATTGDIRDLGEDLTTGYDPSSGDELSSAANTAVDDYLKEEDSLYDQMTYEVPEVDVGSDTSAIMLSSGFMQSLYSSNSFISRCVTFVLTFGLILYIVGWLKKKSG